MRYALALAAFLVAGPAVARPAEVPLALQGTWATTADACGAILGGYGSDPKAWVKLGPQAVTGAVTGRLIRVIDSRSVETTGGQVEGVPMRYELRSPGLLAETMGDARGAGLYLRCR
jgi:hypothetical protein